MPRPKKQTVDYFPHSCNHKKTMFILEERYGNDGYAFWFKLLEVIGNTKGHYLNLDGPSEMEFLLAKTHVSEVSGLEMLDLLAKLDAIDPEAWGHKAVWCQNFIDGVASVYQNRQQPLPQKPSFTEQESICGVVSTSRNTGDGVVSNGESTQTIVEETIVEESIYSPIEKPIEQHTPQEKPHQIIFNHWNEAKIIQHRALTKTIKGHINAALSNYPKEEIVQAIDNYEKILRSPTHYFKFKWTLGDFLVRGLDKFNDWKVCDANYAKGDNGHEEHHGDRPVQRAGTPGNRPSGAFDDC